MIDLIMREEAIIGRRRGRLENSDRFNHEGGSDNREKEMKAGE